MKRIFTRWLPVFLWAGLIFYLSSRSGLSSGLPWPYDFILRKGAHITEFAVLFLLLWRALVNRKSLLVPPRLKSWASLKGRETPLLLRQDWPHPGEALCEGGGGWQNEKAILLALLLSVIYAISDEYHQSFVAQRFTSPVDVAIDSLGILVAAFWQWRRFW